MQVDQFWSLHVTDVINFLILLATICAIVYGPIKAVSISRDNDDRKDAERRKLQIFAALMRTRKAFMHQDHVGTLNLIQLEFFDHSAVIAAYRAYIANLSEPVPQPGNDLDNFMARRRDIFFDLLHEISKAVNREMDRRDLDRLAYVPVGWQSEEDEARLFRRALVDVLHGRRPLIVAPFQGQAASPYPPPPPG